MSIDFKYGVIYDDSLPPKFWLHPVKWWRYQNKNGAPKWWRHPIKWWKFRNPLIAFIDFEKDEERVAMKKPHSKLYGKNPK